jgi:phytoene synthase
MLTPAYLPRARAPWTEAEWIRLERQTCRRALTASSDTAAAAAITREARGVLRAYSTSFFMVTRFLPPAKRAKVEAIYAAVRYPDEVVDTFPLSPPEQIARLNAWGRAYETALAAPSLRGALSQGVPCFVALFASVVQDDGIPPRHYHAFLDAMRHDAAPREFASLTDLIESYIYGSAVVVGYFLAHVYRAQRPNDFDRTLRASRNLGVALQLTNFLRDVGEDQRRGRVYLPQDLLRDERIDALDVRDRSQHPGLARVLRRLSETAEALYARAAADLDSFAADSRTAIKACIDVYRQLNQRIGASPDGILHRAHVPLAAKYRVLPNSKYWRLPLAYLGH